MKTIGIIGGITWYSTVDYYRLLNEMANKKMGAAHSAKLLLYSLDFAEIKSLTEKEDWNGIEAVITDAAIVLQNAGAECILLAANTMHNIADGVAAKLHVPLIHIATAVAVNIQSKGLKKVALLGTKYTMQMDFFKQKLLMHGIETIIPSAAEIDYINNSIYTEFSKGIFLPETKKQYLQTIDSLILQGAEGIILGCTEIPILIKQEDCTVPVFDTTFIHATAAIQFALE